MYIRIPGFFRKLQFLRIVLSLWALGAVPFTGKSQTYNFAHYDIEDGLVQSQIQKIYQDQQRYIWFATLGGLSRFDGKEFRSYTKSDGLGKSMVTSVLRDNSGRVWIGSEDGVSRIYRNKIVNIRAPQNVPYKLVRSIIADKSRRILLTMNSRLCFIQKEKIVFSTITSPDEFVTALTTTKEGVPYAAVYGKGVYFYNGRSWVKRIAVPDGVNINRIVFDRNDKTVLYLLSYKQIFIADRKGLRPYAHELLSQIEAPLTSLEQDSRGFLWVGTNNGAYWLKSGGGVHFTAANGFSNMPVRDIYRDAEENIWLATDGAGAYRFDGGAFLSYHTLNGSTPIIMGMAKDGLNNLWIGTSGNGVMRYNGKEFQNIPIPSSRPYSRNVLTLTNDHNRAIYAGTLDGLWKFDGGRVSNILADFSKPTTIKTLFADHEGTLWIGAPRGVFYFRNGRVDTIAAMPHSVSAMAEIGRDSVLVATNHGIFLIKNKIVDKNFRLPATDNSTILSMLNYRGCVLAGSFGDGLFVIDVKKRRVKVYNMKQGLNSNDVYSLAADSMGYVWGGTGKGVHRFRVNPGTLTMVARNEALPNVLFESNSNAILNLSGKMWIGTTKGLYVYETNLKDGEYRKPYINLQSVKIMNQSAGEGGQPQSLSYDDDAIPKVFNLGYKQNRIVISFTGIYLTDPGIVSYQYRLRGNGETFSQPVKSSMIEIPSLLPGTYTFEVKAVTGNGAESDTAWVTFVITPPFYQTLVFRIMAIVLITALIIGIQYYWTYSKEKQKRVLREIKRDEQMRIRRQTAEDFHDDIGNKLTRIAVLSDLLNKQIPDDQTGQKNLVKQIKGNAATLYSGTKDILWALDPQSDNIDEIINYINNLGTDLFSTSDITFSFQRNGIKVDKKLPMEFSRNISMIVKESYYNILKHADAKKVEVTATVEKSGIHLSICDDGKGFVQDTDGKGRGLNNMKVRAQRISGSLKVSSVQGEGTCILLSVPINGDYKEIIMD